MSSADSELLRLNSALRGTWTVTGWCQWAKWVWVLFGQKGMQRRNEWSYQGLFGTAFADAHLLVSSCVVGAESQIFQTSFIWLHGDVISEGRGIQSKLSKTEWIINHVAVRECKYSAPLPQFLRGTADVELLKLICLVIRLSCGNFSILFPH